jgi:hypothetical protein
MPLPTLPNTNDGRIHRAISWQLYKPLAKSTAAGGATARQNAQTLAKQCDIITGQFVKLADHAGAMYTANANLILMPYQKSVELPNSGNLGGGGLENIPQLPYRWMAHNDWTSGTLANSGTLVHNGTGYGGGTVSGSGIQIMMADTTNDDHSNTGIDPTAPSTWWKLTTTDPTGASVSYYNWKEFNSKYCAADVTNENNKYSNDPWRGIWFDSAGSFAYTTGTTTPVQRGGSAFASAYDFCNTSVWPVGDQAMSDNPSLIVWFNGGAGASTAAINQDILDHCHGAMNEGVFSPASTSDYPIESAWSNIIQATQQAQVSNGTITGGKSKYIQWLEYCTGSTWNTATWNNFRRFVFGSSFFANRGKLIVEFYRGTGGAPSSTTSIDPWLEYGEDPGLYDLTLGAPSDTQNTMAGYTAGGSTGVAGGQTGLYARRFANGIVLMNFNGSSRTYVADRNYTLLNKPGVTTTTKVASAGTITVPGVGTDGTGVVTVRIYTTSDTPPPPPTSGYQDRILSQFPSTPQGSIVVGAAAPSSTDSLTPGAQSFRATWEAGDFSEWTSHSGSQVSVLSGHPHTGTKALQVAVTTSATGYARKAFSSPATGMYGRVWFSVNALFNATTFLAQFVTTGANNQPTLRTNPAGDIIAALAPKSGSATAAQAQTLYTLDPANDLGDYFRFEWFADFSNGSTGYLHAWLYNAAGGLLGSTGTNSGNTTGSPLSFTGADYVQSTITEIRVGILNSTPTSGTAWIDESGYNAVGLGRVGA